MIRLNKFLSNKGVCSRREADVLISGNRVKVNGALIVNLGAVILHTDKVEVDCKIVENNNKVRLFIYYKPVGLINTSKDPQGRPTIFDDLKNLPRLISIGRLDLNSEGLLLLTNNGDLARKFELPSSKLKRIYKVRAFGDCDSLIKHFKREKSIKIDDTVYNVEDLKLIKNSEKTLSNNKNNRFKVTLTEGKNREIRKIFEYFNLKVNRLIRTNYGPFRLEGLKPSEYKEVDERIVNEYLSPRH